MKRARRPLVPLPTGRGPMRLWPRTRPINRHIVERSLRIAAFGPHTCRPFPVRITAAAVRRSLDKRPV